MKKLFAILPMILGTTLAHGQATIQFFISGLNPNASVFTNSQTTIYGTPTGSGARGRATSPPDQAAQYCYALLTADYTGSLTTTNPLDPAFTFTGLQATNWQFGGFRGSLLQPVPGWGAPSGGTYDTGERKYFLLVGWSANLGLDWETISGRIATGFSEKDWIGDAFYGVSQLGNGYGGGGPSNLPPSTLFGISTAMPGGLTSGFDLYLIPEPTTFTLASLGAGTMLILRRGRRATIRAGAL
jgi:hypothetical protein